MAYESLIRVQEDKMDALHAASAILYAAEISEQVSRDAIQIHGGVPDVGMAYIRPSEDSKKLL